MITIFCLIFLVTCWCNGIYIAGRDEGDILYWLNKSSRSWGWFGKPVFQCINCMASLHTLLVMVLYFAMFGKWPVAGRFVGVWLIVAVVCSFTNGLFYLLYYRLELSVHKYWEDKNSHHEQD